MSFLEINIIAKYQDHIFGIDMQEQLLYVQEALLNLKGIKNVAFNELGFENSIVIFANEKLDMDAIHQITKDIGVRVIHTPLMSA